jgi:hypothetical protein
MGLLVPTRIRLGLSEFVLSSMQALCVLRSDLFLLFHHLPFSSSASVSM